jgi:hypothetical protein
MGRPTPTQGCAARRGLHPGWSIGITGQQGTGDWFWSGPEAANCGLFSFSGISDSKEYDGKKMIDRKLEKE